MKLTGNSGQKLLAISWNRSQLHYVFGRAGKSGALELLATGVKPFQELPSDDDPTEPNANTDGSQSADDSATPSDAATREPLSVPTVVENLVAELQAKKSDVILCLSRGLVDAVEFNVPPASDAELPTLVRNLAQREFTGLNEDTPLDFVAFPPGTDNTRGVHAFALPTHESALLDEVVAATHCRKSAIVISPHALRVFAVGIESVASNDSTDNEPGSPADVAATVVLCKRDDTVDMVVVQQGLPVLSRTVRLNPQIRSVDIARHVAEQTQRTLISAGSQLKRDVEITAAVVVGGELEAQAIRNELADELPVPVQLVSPDTLVSGDALDAKIGTFAPLVAALRERVNGHRPAIDFAAPRRPPAPQNSRNKILAIAAAVVVLLGGGWFYVQSQFTELEEDNARLQQRLADVSELVKKSRNKRNTAKLLSRWENSRMTWLDELRDLTVRMPAENEVAISQFSAGPSGSGYLVTFQGTGKSPEAVRAMEDNLRDKYHEPKTPGLREVNAGKTSRWSFQTSLRIRNRPRSSYAAPAVDEHVASVGGAKRKQSNIHTVSQEQQR